MFIFSRDFGKHVDPRRWRLLIALAALAVGAVVLQRTSLAPLPHSRDDGLAGVATGLVLGCMALRVHQLRLRERGRRAAVSLPRRSAGSPRRR
jgi:peptidoglycan/LPS O-acetylase OafA/YrhL